MPSADEAAPSQTMLPVELTLIVAATRNMGIGRAGTLPWTGLKKEMAYFARVTKGINLMPLHAVDNPASVDVWFLWKLINKFQPGLLMNAVIMGRKTWDSIPERFRPLKGRLNVVLSRSYPALPWDGSVSDKEPVKFSSVDAALTSLSQSTDVGKVFVIGGAEIYKAALAQDKTKRVLLTRVLTDFECDTSFPVLLSDSGEGEWRKKGKQDLDQWVGEEVPHGIQEENGIQYVFEMYERS